MCNSSLNTLLRECSFLPRVLTVTSPGRLPGYGELALCLSVLQAQSHGEHLPRAGGDAVLPFSPGLVVTESLGMVPLFLGII